MLNKIFPLKLYLHIFQLEGYMPGRFVIWVANNFRTRTLENKKPLIWTQKAKLLAGIALIYLIILNVLFFAHFSIIGLLISLMLSTQTYIFLILALITLKPYEVLNRIKIKRTMRTKIARLKSNGLVVIGITGSFGKTTTKEFLYQLLRSKYKVLRTPESYNTLLGIYKVIDLELTEQYEIFICEMGAYHIGEIAELCDVVLPDHGILTGINEQHLERFGSIENTIKAKFELIQKVPSSGYKILNVDNVNVRMNYKQYVTGPLLYGEYSQSNTYRNVMYNEGSLSVDLKIEAVELNLTNVRLAGNGNISNLLGSVLLAYKLNVSISSIRDSIRHIKPISHRLEVHTLGDKTIIDNSYSSNIEGFKSALELLASYTARPKIIITPGIVELGNSTVHIHKELGKLVDTTCDFALLVGKSSRTEALAATIAHEKVVWLTSIKEMNEAILALKILNPVILIENDLPDNY
ncbi:MAG: hypothetical protein RLY61_382 [Candidatus Parcubacteria bacterium]